ncbi:MAG: FAD-binding oxidoreductase [Chloroflexi bacterium]|nr:FAD-binding oxidoreductase [Chloroflexota bacterium]MBV9545820.1 FAD-binding oxidoreductase [Chloroflexota bacterium]
MQTADVVIVGAGVNGLSTAFHLARSGMRRIVVLERRHVAAGATGKSGALVRMHYTNEPETRLAFESLNYFQNWRELVGGECGFQPVGLLVFVPPAFRDHLEANVAMQREVGVNARVITADEAQAIDPSLDVSDVTHVAYEPDSGFADPNATAFGFARAAMARGVEIQLETPVTRILTENGRVTGVETPEGTISAPRVVVVAGAWANQLFGPLGIDLGLVPTLARIAIFRWSFERTPKQLTYIDYVNHTWARPHDGTSTLLGAEVPQDSEAPRGDPDSYVEAVSQDYIDLCRGKIARRFPVMRHSTVRGNWQGILMMSPDSRPIIGHLPEYDGLYCMAGDSGTSFKTSPAIGKCLSELITEGRAKTVDLTPFRASRFAEGKLWRDEYSYGLERATISR